MVGSPVRSTTTPRPPRAVRGRPDWREAGVQEYPQEADPKHRRMESVGDELPKRYPRRHW